MERFVRWRNAHPGHWLTVALGAEAATLMSDARPDVMPWLLVDLWLAHRIWRGGPTALLWFRVMQTLAASLFGIVVVMSVLTGDVGRNAHPGVFALYAISAWCLMSPALLSHVHAVRDARLGARRDAAPAGVASHRMSPG